MWRFVGILFNMLSRFVIAFLPKNKCLSVSWLELPSIVILEPKKIKSVKVNQGLFSSIQFSLWLVSNSLRPHGRQHARPPCPSPTAGVYSDSYPLSRWCHYTISSSAVPFSSCLQSFPSSGTFQMSQLFASSGQSIGVSASASFLPMNVQDWFPLGWTGWISLLSKGLLRVFSTSQFKGISSSVLSFLYSPTLTSHMTTGKP